MKKILVCLAACSIMLFSAAAWAQQMPVSSTNAAESNEAKPRLVIEEMIFDSGDVAPDTVMSHDFVVKNDGDAPLVIEDVRPGCGCSVADYDRTIAPGQTGRITISVSVYRDWAGQGVRKAAWVLTNDPLNPQIRLIMVGHVLPLGKDGDKPPVPSAGR